MLEDFTSIVLTFVDGDKSGISVKEDSSYTIIGMFAYQGSQILGAISCIEALVNSEDRSSNRKTVDGAIRIYDATNNKVIAEEVIPKDSHIPTLITFEAVQNIPDYLATLEVHLKGHGNRSVLCHSLQCHIIADNVKANSNNKDKYKKHK